jgi:molybdate transport system ATP-binding protein
MSLFVDIEKAMGDFRLSVRFETTDGMLALLGPSGSGKSVTLRCIAGTARPDRGVIRLGDTILFDSQKGIDLPPQKRRIGYLFQQYALFPNMTVEQNVRAGTRGGTRAERARKAAQVIASFRLQGLEKRHPAQLSGGQQQRAALARIFAGEPQALLLDEPFSALDDYLKWQLELELSDLLKEYSGAAVFVSHNRDEVYRLCREVCVLTAGRADPQAELHQLFAQPATVGAAEISGCKNVTAAVPGPDGTLDCPGWGVRLKTALPVGLQTAFVGIRAHYFTPAPGENPIPCRVDRVIENVFSTIVMLRTPGGGLLRAEWEKSAWAACGKACGEKLTVYIPASAVMPLAP